MPTKRPKKFDQVKGAKAIARDVVGQVPASRPIEDKKKRPRPKHKKSDLDVQE